MSTKTFRLGALLSMIHNRNLGRHGVQDLYEIASFMVGRPVYTHELVLAAKEVGPEILFQFPELGEIDARTVTQHNWKAWLYAREKEYGDAFDLKPIENSKLKAMDVAVTVGMKK